MRSTARLCAVMFRQLSKVVLVTALSAVIAVLVLWSDSPDARAFSCESDPVSEFGDGVHDVGCEILDGVYVADEIEDVCNVALTDVEGDTRFSAFVGRAVIHLRDGWSDGLDLPGLSTMESDGCGTWQRREFGAAVEAIDEFGSGAYEVGLEIEPGVYVSSVVSERCFWFYLDDWHYLGGSETAVVVWQVGRPIVAIPDDAFGFYSVRCGTWTRRADDAGRSGVAESFGDGS